MLVPNLTGSIGYKSQIGGQEDITSQKFQLLIHYLKELNHRIEICGRTSKSPEFSRSFIKLHFLARISGNRNLSNPRRSRRFRQTYHNYLFFKELPHRPRHLVLAREWASSTGVAAVSCGAAHGTMPCRGLGSIQFDSIFQPVTVLVPLASGVQSPFLRAIFPDFSIIASIEK
jgi:hypothetical protein